jgi:hypothetical protein
MEPTNLFNRAPFLRFPFAADYRLRSVLMFSSIRFRAELQPYWLADQGGAPPICEVAPPQVTIVVEVAGEQCPSTDPN